MSPVVRTILAVVVGYTSMFALVVMSLGLAWWVLGAKGAFAGEGPYLSIAWLAFSIGGGFVAAVVGGFMARRLGGPGAVKGLLVLLLVLGLFSALTAEKAYERRQAAAQTAVESAEIAGKPVTELSFVEAGQVAKNPPWYNWVIPLIGAAGVLIGGKRDD